MTFQVVYSYFFFSDRLHELCRRIQDSLPQHHDKGRSRYPSWNYGKDRYIGLH